MRQVFIFPITDTATVLFNYFRNESEAVQFIEAHGWQLFTISNQVYWYSASNTGSYTKYYFEKEL